MGEEDLRKTFIEQLGKNILKIRQAIDRLGLGDSDPNLEEFEPPKPKSFWEIEREGSIKK